MKAGKTGNSYSEKFRLGKNVSEHKISKRWFAFETDKQLCIRVHLPADIFWDHLTGLTGFDIKQVLWLWVISVRCNNRPYIWRLPPDSYLILHDPEILLTFFPWQLAEILNIEVRYEQQNLWCIWCWKCVVWHNCQRHNEYLDLSTTLNHHTFIWMNHLPRC